MTGELAELVDDVERLVAHAAALPIGALDEETLEHVGIVVADTLGVVAAGCRSPEVVALAADPATGLGATGPARVLTPGTPRGDLLTVAWLNGTAGTFLELDEGCRPTGHPAVHVLPAALAVAEDTRASGADLLRALVAGYEVAARLFESFRLPAAMHPHGHFGAIGAATAVAVLTGEDAVRAARLAATQPLLTGWEACFEGATARNTWAGHANRAGVLASVLGRAGFTGSTASHLSVVAPYLADRAPLTEPVSGDALRVRRDYLKLHSACALTHAALDAALEVRRRLGAPDPSAVRRVEVVTISNNARVARQARPNSLSTRFSLPYAVATALVAGATGPAAFEWRPEVADLAARVQVRVSVRLDEAWPGAAPASVRVVTDAGTVEARVDNPHGHHDDPATRAEVRDKFVALGGTVAAFEALAGVGSVDDCATLPLDVAAAAGSPAGVATATPSM